MEISGYEQLREERIKENLERMQKLGIHDLSLKFKSLNPTPNRRSVRKSPQAHSLPTPSGPVRRSSRLQNSTPVSYSEVPFNTKDKSLDIDDHPLREVGSKPEVYDEEHEKLLGSTEMSWTLFVDGYGKDGKRIYDSVTGKTCHQCRQKTLGHRTHCIKCDMVQGQFCGDCLYMRYGENVLEANQNPNWICPVCRGICNCSLCRQAKGWPPTGTLYRKISSLGYKSVAHYLIQTRRAVKESDEDVGSKVPVSAKRSLPFKDNEVALEQDDSCSKNSVECLKLEPLPEVDATNDGLNDKIKEESLPNEETGDSTVPETGKHGSSPGRGKQTTFLVDNKLEESITELKTHAESKSVPDTTTFESGNNKEIKTYVGSETSPKSTMKSAGLVPPTPDSIVGRLRQMRSNTSNEMGSKNGDYSSKDVTTPDVISGSSRKKHNEELGLINGKRNADVSVTTDVDSIARRLKMRRRG